MMKMKVSSVVGVLVLLAGCQEGAAPAPKSDGNVVSEFVGFADVDNGKLTFSPSGEVGTEQQGLVEATVEQNGVPNDGSPGTVELVTESTGLATTCGGAPSFDGSVRVRSFYGTPLRNVHVEITEMSPATGKEACNSADPGTTGLSNAFGLFSYGNLPACNGSAVANWAFNNTSGTNFSFRGRVMADWCGDHVCNAGDEGCSVSSCGTDCCSVNWCVIQWQQSLTLAANNSVTNYGQIYIDSFTSDANSHNQIEGQLVMGPAGSDHTTWTNVANGTFNVQAGNNDEFQAALTAPDASSGTQFHYLWRFRVIGQQNWTYCDQGGVGTANPGVLTIE